MAALASGRPTRAGDRTLALASVTVGIIALALDRFLAIEPYPGSHVFFGSVPVFMLALAAGWRPALVAAGIAGLGGAAMWGHPWAWVAYAMEAVAVGQLGRRGHPISAVLGFWLLVGIPLFAAMRGVESGASGMEYVAIALKPPLQELFAILLAQNLLFLAVVRHGLHRVGPHLKAPYVSLVRFQLSFIGLLLIATAGTVMIVQGRAIEHDERRAIVRLDEATAALASAELSSTLQGYQTTLAVASGLWPGLTPHEREARAKAALEGAHFQLFAWLDPKLHVQGGWQAADGGKAARPAPQLDLGSLSQGSLAGSGLDAPLLVVTPGHDGRPPALLVLHRLRGDGYLAGGVSMQTVAKQLRARLADRGMVLELHDRTGRSLVAASLAPPMHGPFVVPYAIPQGGQDIMTSVDVPHTSWRLVARMPGWVLQQRVNATLWHALPPLILLLLVLGAMGAGTMMLLRQELRQITRSTQQLGRLATEEDGVGDPVFEESFLLEVERLNRVYRQVARSLGEAIAGMRKRDAELSVANSQLGGLVDTLKGMDRNRAEVMNAISHDIKIPLTAVIGYTELLEDEVAGPLTKDQREYVKNINENSGRVVHLLEDLLDFARLEVGRFPIEAGPVELEPALDRTLRNLQPLIDGAGLEGTIEVEPGMPVAWADPHRLDQVLNNLLSNAIKFTSKGGHLTLKAMRGQGEDEALVQVIDTGKGIAPEHLSHLFERFYRVPGSKEPGTGLGLAISRKLVEAMGGRMGVLSQPGQGSTFWLTLPLARDGVEIEPIAPVDAHEEVS